MLKHIITFIIIFFCDIALADNLYIFTAKWCGPCNSLKSFLKSDNDVQRLFAISMIDIEEFPEIAKEYNIKTVPTSILIKSDQEYERIIGYNAFYKRKLIKAFERKN